MDRANDRFKSISRYVVDYVTDKKRYAPKNNPPPWALDLAFLCCDMRTGQFIHLPHSGGAMEQDSYLMTAINHAWRAFYVWSIDDERRTSSDRQFMAWVMKG